MATTLRVEFVTLGRGGFSQRSINSLIPADVAETDTPATLNLTTSGLTGNGRVRAPVLNRNGELYARITAIGGPAHVLISKAGTVATLTNGIRLPADLPELFAVRSQDYISAVAEA